MNHLQPMQDRCVYMILLLPKSTTDGKSLDEIFEHLQNNCLSPEDMVYVRRSKMSKLKERYEFHKTNDTSPIFKATRSGQYDAFECPVVKCESYGQSKMLESFIQHYLIKMGDLNNRKYIWPINIALGLDKRGIRDAFAKAASGEKLFKFVNEEPDVQDDIFHLNFPFCKEQLKKIN